ncbi:MAG: response regulator transcription factor [Deltaproteobacteria bacterium]|nr:response regulator transcription factor [Deltaproteobacteria bacterium]
MIKILVVDDHTMVRTGMKQLLTEQLEAASVGEAADGDQALAIIQKEPWDIVILDVTLPDRNGLQILKILKQDHPNLPVLILSMHPEEEFAIEALRRGAAGYITKQSAADELVAAVRKVLAGGKYISSQLGEHLALSLGSETIKAPHENLSEREYQVLCLMASGETPTMIAKKLELSVKTISTHRAHILEKLHMTTNAQLIHYALKHHLVA